MNISDQLAEIERLKITNLGTNLTRQMLRKLRNRGWPCYRQFGELSDEKPLRNRKRTNKGMNYHCHARCSLVVGEFASEVRPRDRQAKVGLSHQTGLDIAPASRYKVSQGGNAAFVPERDIPLESGKHRLDYQSPRKQLWPCAQLLSTGEDHP